MKIIKLLIDDFAIIGKNFDNTNSKNLLNKSLKPSETKQNTSIENLVRNNDNSSISKRPQSGKKPASTKSSAPKKNIKQNENISKDEIFQKLGILNPETEHQLDLSNVVPYNADGKPKSKREIATDVIGDLQKQIEKLKYRRDSYLEVNLYLSNE